MDQFYYDYHPNNALHYLVRNFFHAEFNASNQGNFMLPNGLATLFYLETTSDFDIQFFDTYNLDKLETGVYVGYMNKLSSYTHDQIRLFGANCYPVMFSMFFEGGLEPFTNRCVKLDDVVELDELRAGSEGELSRNQVFKMLEKYMLRKTCEYPGNSTLTHLYERLMTIENYQYTVEDLAHWASCSTRHLRSQFHEYLGMPPKKFLQVLRFNKALWHMDHGSQNLGQIAYACGYHDQAHFINNFKRICGRKPTDVQDLNESLAGKFRLFKSCFDYPPGFELPALRSA